MSLTVNSETYYQNIRNKLTELCSLVAADNSVNIQSLNIHAEGFYAEFLNCLFDWNLVNANVAKQNAAGIDLIDAEKKIIVQVSSTHTRDKIKRSLKKSDKEEYAGYHFYFVAIAENETNYRTFEVPDRLTFDKSQDVLSLPVLRRHVLNAGIEKQKALSELMDKYFGSNPLPIKGQCLTEAPGYADTNSVICRENELGEIEAMLQEKKSVLLMSGFGGIGKTALARLVFHTVRENYDQVAWIPYSKNLKESMLRTIEGLKGNNPEERWLEIQRILNNGASKLIVIDNADQDDSINQLPHKDDDLIALTGRPDVTIIVTSRRNKLPSFTTYPVGFMDEGKCISLFYCYYDGPQSAEDEPVVRKLIKMAGCHTFTVELLAKGANCEDSLEAYYQDLKNEGFSFPEIEVEAAHNDVSTTIAGHLKILFDRKTRTDIQMELLYDFSVLPAAATLNKKEIKAWFGIDVNTCEQLVKDGWLLREGGRYAMHPLVKEILHLDPIPEHTAEKFRAFIENWNKGYFSDNDVHTARDRKLALAESVVDAVCREDTLQLAHIHHNMGEAYRQAGQYPQAEAHDLRAIAIKEAKLEKDHPDTAATYHNIANVYYAKGDLDKALEFYEKALAIREAKLRKDHPDTAATYNNIATVYRAKGDLDKALKFHEKALTIREAKLGKDHPDTAATYNNIANVYKAKGDQDKALESFEKALAIKEAKLGKDHPSTARTYGNMGVLYYAKEDYKVAENYLLLALRVFLRKLPFEHSDVLGTRVWLSACHKAEGNPPETFDSWLMGQLDEKERESLAAHQQEDHE